MTGPPARRAIVAALGLAIVFACAVPASGSPPDPVHAPVPATVRAAAGAPILTAHFTVDATSRIAKLGSNIVVGQGSFDAGLFNGPSGTVNVEGDLRLPKSSGYFVVFRFVPVTNDVELVPDGKAAGTADISKD